MATDDLFSNVNPVAALRLYSLLNAL